MWTRPIQLGKMHRRTAERQDSPISSDPAKLTAITIALNDCGPPRETRFPFYESSKARKARLHGTPEAGRSWRFIISPRKSLSLSLSFRGRGEPINLFVRSFGRDSTAETKRGSTKESPPSFRYSTVSVSGNVSLSHHVTVIERDIRVDGGGMGGRPGLAFHPRDGESHCPTVRCSAGQNLRRGKGRERGRGGGRRNEKVIHPVAALAHSRIRHRHKNGPSRRLSNFAKRIPPSRSSSTR